MVYVNNSTISRTYTPHVCQIVEPTTYSDDNLSYDLGQTKKCGGVTPFNANGIQTLPFFACMHIRYTCITVCVCVSEYIWTIIINCQSLSHRIIRRSW